jgi:very-short-patch-repair endonuclease
MTRSEPRLDPEQDILSLAARQYGVVSRTQLLDMGVGADQVAARVRRHRLRPLQRGVYLVGPLVVPRTHPMSALLCFGESATVSHWSAAALWQVMEQAAESAAVDVVIPPGERRRRPGVRIHRIELQRDEVTELDGIRITTPARTLYDLAGSIGGRDLEQAVAEALVRRLTDRSGIAELVKRYGHRPAARRLMALVSADQGPALTRSAAEEALLALIRRGQLPRPEMNVRVHGHEVDLYWRAARLVAEMDGFAFHGSRRRFEADRRRDAELAANGPRVMRVTWRQLENEPEALLVRLAQALVRGP